MKPQTLLLLALLLAGLVFLAFWTRPQPPPTLQEETALQPLAPKDFTVSSLEKVEIYVEEKKGDKVVLRQENGAWTLPSRFDAPADKNTVETFLRKLGDLTGELRATDQAVLEDFSLNSGKTLHFALYRKGQESPWVHLLSGKTAGWQNSFVRKDGSPEAYLVNVNLSSEVGLYGGDEGQAKAPESSHWLDKTILALNKDQQKKLAYTCPDKRFTVEKVEKEKPPEPEKKPGPDREKKPETPAPPPAKTWEWVLEGKPPENLKYKSEAVSPVLEALASWKGEDVADPAKLASSGLDQPAFQLEVTPEKGDAIVILGSHPDPEKSAYVQLKGKPGLVYQVSDYEFKRVFPSGGNFFELPGLGLEEKSVSRVKLSTADGTVVADKSPDGSWKLSQPDLGLPAQEGAVKEIAATLASWKPVDFATGADLIALGFEKPQLLPRLDVTAGEKNLSLILGGPVPGQKARYLRTGGPLPAWVVSASDQERLFPSLKKFFDLARAPGLKKETLTSVAIKRQEEEILLRRREKTWEGQRNGQESFAVDEGKIGTYLDTLAGLAFPDLTANEARLGETTAFLAIRQDDPGRKEIQLAFGKLADGQYAVKMSGSDAVFLLPEAEGRKLLAGKEQFLKPPPPIAPSTPPAESTGGK